LQAKSRITNILIVNRLYDLIVFFDYYKNQNFTKQEHLLEKTFINKVCFGRCFL